MFSLSSVRSLFTELFDTAQYERELHVMLCYAAALFFTHFVFMSNLSYSLLLHSLYKPVFFWLMTDFLVWLDEYINKMWFKSKRIWVRDEFKLFRTSKCIDNDG